MQIKGKVNTIMLDGCSKVGLVFNSVLATVEAVNCQSCQIQCEQTCPTLSIDKTDGAKVRHSSLPFTIVHTRDDRFSS